MTNLQDVANTVLHILRDPATGPALTLAFATGSYLFKRHDQATSHFKKNF
jgi:hypothetical protein